MQAARWKNVTPYAALLSSQLNGHEGLILAMGMLCPASSRVREDGWCADTVELGGSPNVSLF